MNITSAVDAIIHAVLPVSIFTTGDLRCGTDAAAHEPPANRETAMVRPISHTIGRWYAHAASSGGLPDRLCFQAITHFPPAYRGSTPNSFGETTRLPNIAAYVVQLPLIQAFGVVDYQ
jgi:hypothetical protein